MYQTQEFAELAGVTVRTLHHYDRIGLLKPSRRTAAGYRLYGESDLRRLEQIVVLKFLGLSLREIRDALQKGPESLGEVLARQRRALETKQRDIGAAVRAIAAAERALSRGSQTDTQIFEIIRSVTDMDNSNEWMMQYYSPAARAKIEARAKTWTPELQAQCEQGWAELLAEVREAMVRGDDPASPHVQALAARWKALVEGFTGGDPEVTEGLKRLYADRANWQGDLDGRLQKFPIDSSMSRYIASAGAASTKAK